MFCSKCGAELTEDIVFCPKCGTKVSAVQDSESVKTEEDDKSQKITKDKVESKIKKALTLSSVKSDTERNGKNVVVSFMPETMYKLFFYGVLVGSIMTIPSGIGILGLLMDIFILKDRWASKVKGFIVDYDKQTIYIPECIVTYDTGFDIKKFWHNYRKGIEFNFDELKSLETDFQQEYKEKQVNDYKIINAVTKFGTIKIKMGFANSNFEKILDSLEDVIAYNEANQN